MRTITAFLIFFLALNTAEAQIKKGNKLVGASFGNANVVVENGFSLQLNPTIGFMLTDHWMLGSGVTLGAVFSGGFTGIAGINPFARYYLPNRSKTDSLYKGFFLQTTTGLVTVFGAQEQNSFQGGFGGGYTRFITPEIGLELGAMAHFSKIFSDADGTFGLGLSIGLQIMIGKDMRIFKRKR